MTALTFPDFATYISPSTTRSSIWFLDGNVVLQAESTQFCVHKGVLTHHSAVFRELFDHSNSSSATYEHLDGLLLRHMPDSAEDMTYLLHALYEHSELPITPVTVNTSAMLSAVLRLSTKYRIPSLRAAVCNALTSQAPLEYLLDLSRPTTLADYRAFRSSSGTLASDVQLANACEEAKARYPLAIFLYRCALANHEDLLEPSLSFTSANLRRVLKFSRELRSDISTSLSDCLEHAFSPQTQTRSPGDVYRCETPRACTEAFTRCIQEWNTRMISYEFHGFASWYVGRDWGVCGRCHAWFCHSWLGSRFFLALSIPQSLGLGTWKELKESDDAFQASLG